MTDARQPATLPSCLNQAALERLEGRGGETWRGCLQRMVRDQGLTAAGQLES